MFYNIFFVSADSHTKKKGGGKKSSIFLFFFDFLFVINKKSVIFVAFKNVCKW